MPGAAPALGVVVILARIEGTFINNADLYILHTEVQEKMEVSYRHANPNETNESYVLRFDFDVLDDDPVPVVLIDSGRGVDLDSLLAENEYLAAVLLTHAHRDHYETIAENHRDGAPIYTSPTMARVLDTVIDDHETAVESQQDHGAPPGARGLTSFPIDSVEGIDEWMPVIGESDLQVRPIPAGHIPGACGFLLRFADGEHEEVHTILSTGDFTTEAAGGFEGYPFDLPDAVNPEIVFLTAATEDRYTDALTDVVGDALSHSYTGGRTLVKTNAFQGVALAYLLANATPDAIGLTYESDRPAPPITLCGMVAKLYDAVGYDLPNVRSCPEFESDWGGCEGQFAQGGITIAAPVQTSGGRNRVKSSSEALTEVIRQDANAKIIQVTSDWNADVYDEQDAQPVTPEIQTDGSGASRSAVQPSGDTGMLCAVSTHEVIPHPTRETVIEAASSYEPSQVVMTHASSRVAKTYTSEIKSFTWATDDEMFHTLYRDGEFTPPPWMTSDGVAASEHATGATGTDMSYLFSDAVSDELDTEALLPSLTPSSDTLASLGERRALEAEGVSVPQIKEDVADVYERTSDPTDDADAEAECTPEATVDAESAEATDEHTPGGEQADSDPETAASQSESLTPLLSITRVGTEKIDTLHRAGYDTLADVRAATTEELRALDGVGEHLADRMIGVANERHAAVVADEPPARPTANAALHDRFDELEAALGEIHKEATTNERVHTASVVEVRENETLLRVPTAIAETPGESIDVTLRDADEPPVDDGTE